MRSKRSNLRSHIWIGCLFFGLIALAHGGRVKVAVIDGAPVYRWTVFRSIYPDDVDRALILREFNRQGFEMPQYFIDESLQKKIMQDFGGDRSKLIKALEQEGETLNNFRQFTREELILLAMRWRETKQGKDGRPPRSEAAWLASLRRGARIERLEQRSHRR
jgi:hypothetical protein